MEISELINAIYHYDDGVKRYEQIIRFLTYRLFSRNEAQLFADELLKRCMPIAAKLDITLDDLVELSIQIAHAAYKAGIFDRDAVINSIHRLLYHKYAEVTQSSPRSSQSQK